MIKKVRETVWEYDVGLKISKSNIVHQSKEIKQQMRSKIIYIYQAKTYFKAIFKATELQWTTVNYSESCEKKSMEQLGIHRTCCPTKINLKAHSELIQQVIKTQNNL